MAVNEPLTQEYCNKGICWKLDGHDGPCDPGGRRVYSEDRCDTCRRVVDCTRVCKRCET